MAQAKTYPNVTDLDSLMSEFQAECNAVADEFKIDKPKPFTTDQLINFGRQAYRQRCHTGQFQKNNRKTMAKVEELLKAKGISLEDLISEARGDSDDGE